MWAFKRHQSDIKECLALTHKTWSGHLCAVFYEAIMWVKILLRASSLLQIQARLMFLTSKLFSCWTFTLHLTGYTRHHRYTHYVTSLSRCCRLPHTQASLAIRKLCFLPNVEKGFLLQLKSLVWWVPLSIIMFAACNKNIFGRDVQYININIVSANIGLFLEYQYQSDV